MKKKQLIKKLPEVIKDKLQDRFNKEASVVTNMIMDSYDMNLNGVDTDKNSKAKPEYFQDAFKNVLNEYGFFIETLDGLTFRTPDVTTLDLSGLEVLQAILEGISGTYVVATGDQITKVTKKTTIHKDPVDSSVPPKERVYLIRFADPLRRKMELQLKMKLPLYAFSNTPPIDIFSDADQYVEDNIKKWIDESISDAITEFKG